MIEQCPPTGPDTVEVVVESEISVGAGQVVIVSVLVRHWGLIAAPLTVSVIGLDASWAPAPTTIAPVEPGVGTRVDIALQTERGALAARYPFVIAVQAPAVDSEPELRAPGSPSRPSASSSPRIGMAEAVLVLNAPHRVAITLEPQQPSAVFTKKIAVTLTNPGKADATLDLQPKVARGAKLRMSKFAVTVPAGRTVVVKGRIRVQKPSFIGADNTFAYSVTARSSGAPQYAEGLLRSRPFLRGWALKSLGLVLVAAMFIGIAVIAVPRLRDAFAPKDALSSAQEELARSAAEAAASTGEVPSPPASADAAQGDASPGESGAAATPGESTGPAAPGAVDVSGASGVGGGNRLAGTVLGSDPTKVTVLVEPTSVVQAQDVGAQPATGLVDPSVASGLRQAALLGKMWGSSLRQQPSEDATAGRRSTVPFKDGSWSFAGINGPGYYLATFAQPGYQTQRYIIDPALLADADPMKIQLVPGQGKLSGAVASDTGPVGAATVTITDGTNSLVTSSISTGETGGGNWEVGGLSTPGSYLITVRAAGFGTTSALVTLGAGGSQVVDLALKAGVGSITGSVTGVDQFGVVGGLGGLTVIAVDGDLTRSANTITSGAVGRFTLPDLPTPGTYTLTISGNGYQPKTRQVKLAAGAENALVDLSMTRSDGVVAGMVSGGDNVGLAGAGLTLTGTDASYKTMTASAPPGSFRFAGVGPGIYVLSASMYGRKTTFATVQITAAETALQDLTLSELSDGELARDSKIRGRAVDARTGGPLTCDRAAQPNPKCVVTVTTTVDTVSGPHPSSPTPGPGMITRCHLMRMGRSAPLVPAKVCFQGFTRWQYLRQGMRRSPPTSKWE
ncbi:carboxypeptidase regulatory-like domain-containing protein [Nakamurella antarctica]|uniref:Carboxypeptidase regulatory-like domain-containing protein n=1 Tax=Nakamurella antarctica TaxID=1902245 RepID=A0A3G8ZL87_9ACTN|nr:carboxypeptidase-like regulatory domain-containing protein [Nakamurella antarctica]AZI58013.1 carboxypeptidase regulatory-like domain-containing protein [Nakamurella antarctica]